MAWTPPLTAAASPDSVAALSPLLGPADAGVGVDGLAPLGGESFYDATHYAHGGSSAEAGVPSVDLATRLLAALEGQEPEREISEDLMMELGLVVNPADLLWLLQVCSESLLIFRQRYCRALGLFCVEAVRRLARMRCDHWQGPTASLRVLESVVLVCTTEPEDRVALCGVLQELLRVRFLSKAGARLESAIMALGDPMVRRLYAPEQPLGLDLDVELGRLSDKLAPTQATLKNRRKAFDIFDDIIYRCFGLRGNTFGSAVNGFQLQSSDIDISVLLPTSVREKLLADCRRQKAEGVNRPPPEGAEPPPPVDWSFLTTAHPMQAACVAAARVLASELRKAGLIVVDVVERARVPIIKCKHRITAEPEDASCAEAGGAGASGDVREFEVDISFCNEVAYYNSRLLKAYASFDPRCIQVCRLVKLWAKRRKINSPFDGTLSSYAYSLLVIDYLQRRGVLPKLQCPRQEVLEEMGLSGVGQQVLESGHNVWYLDPADVRARRAQANSPQAANSGKDAAAGEAPTAAVAAPAAGAKAQALAGVEAAEPAAASVDATGPGDPEDRGGTGRDEVSRVPKGDAEADAAPCTWEERKWWLGTDPPKATVAELFYGFFRFFALEFNLYADVSSIRFDDKTISKPDYFLADVSEDEELEGAAEEAAFGPFSQSPSLHPESPYLGPYAVAISIEEVQMPSAYLEMLPPLAPRKPSDDTGNQSAGECGQEPEVDTEEPDACEEGKEASEELGEASVEGEKAAEEATEAATDGEAAGMEDASEEGKIQEPDQEPGPDAAAESGGSEASKEAKPGEADNKAASEATGATDAEAVVPPSPSLEASDVYYGNVRSFNLEMGFGFIECEKTSAKYDRDVFLHQNQAAGVAVSDRVCFMVELNAKGQPQARQVRKVVPNDTELPQPAMDALLAPEYATVPAMPFQKKEVPRAVKIAQKRMRDRICLCIDDPMERHRTLGATFNGQELISYEMRRALSLLKKGTPHSVEELFREKDMLGSASKRRSWAARDFSPIPHQATFSIHAGGEHVSTVVEIERTVKKELVGRIIGSAGTTVKNIQKESGVEDVRVIDHKGGEAVVHVRGETEKVVRALALVEQLQKTGKQRVAPGASLRQQIVGPREPGLVEGSGPPLASPHGMVPLGSPSKEERGERSSRGSRISQASAATAAAAVAAASAAAQVTSVLTSLAAGTASAGGKKGARDKEADDGAFMVVPPKIGAEGVMSCADLEKNLAVQQTPEFKPARRPGDSPVPMMMMSCEDLEKSLTSAPKVSKGSKDGKQKGDDKGSGSGMSWLTDMLVEAPKAGAPGVMSCADFESKLAQPEPGKPSRKRRNKAGASSVQAPELVPEQTQFKMALNSYDLPPSTAPENTGSASKVQSGSSFLPPEQTATSSRKSKSKANKIANQWQ